LLILLITGKERNHHQKLSGDPTTNYFGLQEVYFNNAVRFTKASTVLCGIL